MLSPKTIYNISESRGPVAQLGRTFARIASLWKEHLAFNQVARGSNPLRPALFELLDEPLINMEYTDENGSYYI